jgi:alkylation response protein AidB-like acyl-CoA dehydrogenase/putative sterol carrier protein
MSQYFTEEHELFRQSAREFIQKEVIPNSEKWEEEEMIPRELFRKMGEQGFLGINFPEQYGGTNNDFWYTVVWLEEIAKSKLGGVAAGVSVHQYMATNHIQHAGNDALKQKYLPKSIKGEFVGSIAISEPGAGSDVAAMRTTAKKEGDYYIINGSKTFITNGYYGNFVTVACKTDTSAGMAGISLIVVDQGIAGFTKSKLKKMGWKSSDTAELFFDNVKVPASNLVGQEGKGFFYIMESFQLERLVAAIMAVAGAEFVIDMTLSYMKERSAFGKPIAKFQVLRHKLVDLATELEITKRFVYYCCDLFARGVFCVKECSMAKMKSTELGKTIADECLQMFGGYGWMSEYPIERCYRDARVGTIVGGTTEIMKEIIAKMVVDGINYESAYKNMKAGGESVQNKPAAGAPAEGSVVAKPSTARDIVYSLPQRLKTDKVEATAFSRFHFKLEGESGGNFTVTLKDKAVVVVDGLVDEPTCEIKAKAGDYEDLELGRSNPQTMFMMGKIKVTNLSEVMKFVTLFSRIK